MRELYWLQNDLRLNDHPGLLAHASADELLLVYCLPPSRPWCNTTGMGQHRERFLLESLLELRRQLQALGQDVLISRGHPERVIPQLVQSYRIDRVGTALNAGYYERKILESLQDSLTVPLKIHAGNTVFRADQFPFDASTLPHHFTPFRKAVEDNIHIQLCATPSALPPPPASVTYQWPFNETVSPPIALPVRGGAAEGQNRLHKWLFELHGIARYQSTRNCLDGLDGSSTLSPWLANGSLSVRETVVAIQRYEKTEGTSDSTRALLHELLWREFFYWRAMFDDTSLFQHGGKQKRLSRCTFEPRNFARWSQGDTNYPLVNACMRQLTSTGWMSNRGRQIAASCLINELGIDWRYGAAFFEKHLIDYDVASNYGNWQYIAGVGADPRGGRHFNLEKQAAEHDPQQLFTTKWGGFRPQQPDYVMDAADWPLPPG